MIGDNIVVSVQAVHRGFQAVLGVSAPRSIPVHRSEVHEDIARERAAQARLKGGLA